MDDAARVRALQAEIDEQRSVAAGVSSPRCDGLPSGPSCSGDKVADAVSDLIGLIEDYCAELAAYVDEQREAHESLSLMGDQKLAEVLKRRYLLCQGWSEICAEMGYTYDGIMKLSKRALLEAYWCMPHRWRDPVHRAI